VAAVGDRHRGREDRAIASRSASRLRVRDATASAQELISTLSIDPDLASPFEVARFVKTGGRLGELEIGVGPVSDRPG